MRLLWGPFDTSRARTGAIELRQEFWQPRIARSLCVQSSIIWHLSHLLPRYVVCSFAITVSLHEMKTKIAKKTSSLPIAKVKPPLIICYWCNESLNEFQLKLSLFVVVCAITARLRCETDIERQPAVQSLTLFFLLAFLRYDKVSATKKKTFSEKEKKSNNKLSLLHKSHSTLAPHRPVALSYTIGTIKISNKLN